ncbi:DUF1572 family protein [Flavobacterium sedimenticola]|uniref:DUF1572 family protein n=1 Tax=Flavobacterium sedimenticola TaxID=3043286 RepID=A0ABT6XTG2_9FLAO|nr:DUF1572 family protein [Flavobacterium sedimenticola]MDI9258303.1 DUF1572 family protein [Flavobacterium sedimenticola]
METGLDLANRFRDVIINGKWIANTNFKEQLTGTSLEMATSVLGSANSIAVLAQHIHYYINGLNTVFNGGTLDIKDQYSFDFRSLQTQEEWDYFLTTFWNHSETFANHVQSMSEATLSQVFVAEKYGTYRRNIEAMIEHSYYHLGQIVLLKKLVLQRNETL